MESPMSSIAQALWLPCLTTIVFMLVLRPVARGIGLVDRPGGRKTHEGEIPVIGGIAMLAGVVVGALSRISPHPVEPYFAAALFIVVLVGVIDDRYDLPASVRILAHVLATCLVVFGAGWFVSNIGPVFFGGVVGLSVFNVPFTILIVLSAINAFNMFDGSDGIAGIQALVGLVFLGIACMVFDSNGDLPLLASISGSILGFLLFNWPAKRTASVRAFMGDAGSTMLGFVLAWTCISLSQRPVNPVMHPVGVLWIFTLPLYDMFGSMIRRGLRGQSPFDADTEHFHHLMKRLGCSARAVALLVLLISAVTAAIGVGGQHVGLSDSWSFMFWLAGGVAYFFVLARGKSAIGRPASAMREQKTQAS
jgi:UDP-GlcNAc:undecaprenyl-phosphate GlcNAc-1-phosphate transferase